MPHLLRQGDSVKLEYKLERHSKPLPRNLSPLMADIAAYLVSSSQRKIAEGIPPANAPLTKAVKNGDRTLRDMGLLTASITPASSRDTSEAGTNMIYARLMHFGGTVTPKRANALYIPASASSRSLMRKFGETPGKCISGMKAAGYQIWKSKSGKALLAKNGKDGALFTLFIIKKSVTVPARPFFVLDEADRAVMALKLENYLKGKVR